MSKKAPNKNEIMRDIIAKVGKERAIDLVMQSYNTELLATRLKRLEDGTPGIGAYTRRDHLQDALARVLEVCELVRAD
ncbi:MAG TPA: hypothetical protein VG734_03445 [Lacunisphaera sp.]|nr:hypothetical protein [Lacunisphaera sp.]